MQSEHLKLLLHWLRGWLLISSMLLLSRKLNLLRLSKLSYKGTHFLMIQSDVFTSFFTYLCIY